MQLPIVLETAALAVPSGSSMSAVRFEQSAHHGSTWCVSAGQRVFVVRGGVEPPTFRFSEGLSWPDGV